MNVPVGLLGIWFGLRYLPKLKSQTQAKLDKLGMIFGPIAFAALVYGVNQAGDAGWGSIQTVIGLAVGVAALLLFILIELGKSEPLLERECSAPSLYKCYVNSMDNSPHSMETSFWFPFISSR